MSIYFRIYYSLVERKSQLSEQWKKGSALHRHHIVPKHSGGLNDSSNFTYLTIREHIIAHFLLWKIYRNPNDLRSMKMLGAKLTPQQRKITGEYCRDNGIGFFGASKQKREEWRQRSVETQKNQPNSFYYWASKEGRRHRASLGGKIGGKKQKELKLGWHAPHIQRKAASLGGQSHKGKRCMYKPGDASFIRVKPEDIDAHLNKGFIFGSPIKTKNQYTKTSF